MSGLLVIESVVGLSPDWNLTVENSVGVQGADHVLCGVEQFLAGIFRVVSVPDNLHVVVKDDVAATPYGQPAPGEASYYTPIGALQLSQVPRGGLNYDEAQRRDNQLVGQSIRTTLLLTDPTDITADDARAHQEVIVINTVPAAIVMIEDLSAENAGLVLAIANATSSSEAITVAPLSTIIGPGAGKVLIWDGVAWIQF